MRLLLINFLQALRHIKRNKWQTLLVVGILSFAMAAFVFSAAGIWEITHEEHGIGDDADVYALQAYTPEGLTQSNYFFTVKKARELIKNMPEGMIATMASLSGNKLKGRTDSASNQTRPVLLVTPEFFDVVQADFIYGRPVQEEGEVVVSEQAAQVLYGTTDLVGTMVEITLEEDHNKSIQAKVCGIVKGEEGSMITGAQAFLYRKIENVTWFSKYSRKTNTALIVTRTTDSKALMALIEQNNENMEDKVAALRLVPVRMFHLLWSNSSFWKATFYPGIFLILSALLLISASFSYLALLNTNAESRWTEHRLRLSFGAGSDTLRRIYSEVLLVLLAVGFCACIIQELGYKAFLEYMQMPECDVMQWLVTVWFAMVVLLIFLCTIPVYLQHKKYKKAIHGAPQGKSSFLNHIFVTTQISVSVLLLFLVWNGGRQLRYVSHDGLGFNAHKVYTIKTTDVKDQVLVSSTEFAHEVASIAAVDTCIVQAPFYDVTSNTVTPFEGFDKNMWTLQLTPAAMRLFEIKPNLWKDADGEFEMKMGQILLATNTAKYFGITPENPFLPNGLEAVGILDICTINMHQDPYLVAYSHYHNNWNTNVAYFSFHPGKEKEGIAAVEDLLRRRDINVDAGLVRVVNCGDLISDTYEKEQNYLTLYTILAIVGFGIAFFGLLTLVSADLQRQRRSLAIRRIFGATYGVCLRQTLRLYSIVTTLGTIIGLCIGFYLMTMWLETYSTTITLGWGQPLCIALAIALLVIALVAWKVRQCFREKPAMVIKA